MQRSVLERWIDGLQERRFDTPFLIMLRASGFYDIHFTHGSYEFGKDFIAKKIANGEAHQYGFQSKAGDISGSDWDSIHGQMEELVESWLVHPNYDKALPREHRLVVTGALRGKAILSAKQFKERLAARGEGRFRVWDRENLLDMLTNVQSPAMLPSSEAVEHLIAAATTGSLNREMLTQDLEKIVPPSDSIHSLRETLLLNYLLVSHLLIVGRPFYAIRVAQHGVRMALAHDLVATSTEAHAEYLDALSFAVQLGVEHARKIAKLAPIELAGISGDPVGYLAAYPLACFSIIECLGFGLLEALWRGNTGSAQALSKELSTFIRANAGCMHPLSDRFAASLIPAAVALGISGEIDCGQALLRGITKWVCDQIQSGLGLADTYASAREEVERIFGCHFDFLDYQARHESLFTVALADLAYVFFKDVYPSLVNEFKAVGAIFSLVHPLDVPDSMFLRANSTQPIINLEYPDVVKIDTCLEHHSLQLDARSIERRGGPLAPLICGCLCQDRLFTDILPRLETAVHQGWGLAAK